MDEREAIYRLQDHFRIHDDGRPTPLLDEAATMAYKSLSNQKWLKDKLEELKNKPSAVESCYFMNDLYRVYEHGLEDKHYDDSRRNRKCNWN